jgi:hypothetical protein
MPWARPLFTRGQVDKAGQILVASPPSSVEQREHAVQVLSNWRAAHAYPLQVIATTLLERARQVDRLSIVAQRLKRRSSIDVKLRRNPTMMLSRMQDVGGCRAIVRDVALLDALVGLYEGEPAGTQATSELVNRTDYMLAPKADGYRGIHYVYKYSSTSPPFEQWNGLRIEIQLRTRLQHAWATAVETVDTFMGQTLKTGGGEALWRRFFVLMSTAIARAEVRPDCPGSPVEFAEVSAELRELAARLAVESRLQAWSAAMRSLSEGATDRRTVYLLYLDPERDQLTVQAFTDRETAEAADSYLRAEERVERRPASQAVLVSVEALQALRSAFPNYFADTALFVEKLREAFIGVPTEFRPWV